MVYIYIMENNQNTIKPGMNSESKYWKDWTGENCPKCNSLESEVFSKSKKPNLVYDGEKVRCKNCSHDGEIVVEDSECADIFWYDYEVNKI